MGIAIALLILSANVSVPGAATVGAPANGPSTPVVGVSGVWTPSNGGSGPSPGTLDLSHPTAVTGLIAVF